MLRVLALDSDEEDESCDNPTAITFQSLPHIEKLVSERKIYMRAALKLLDQRDRFLEEQIPKRSVVDVIKYGTLKKATGGSVTRVWKEKYVELRHGKFSYGDHTGWGQTSNWKTIPLIATEIRCYQISSNGVENRYIFAIKDTSHKRLWMTDSLEEMMSWIDAIKTAMIGSAGDFASDDVDIDSNCSRNDVKLTDHVDTATLHSVAPIHLWCRPEYIGNESTDYIEGLPAYMSAEIRKFLSIQEAISKSSNSTSYRELLSLYFSEPQFTVPVSFIKSRLENSRSPKITKNHIDKKKYIPTEHSQAWKDLHRDIMIINGERISGGVDGPEAMLGTLVRVILEKVRQMRDRYIEQFPGDPIQKKSAIFSDLDESQALSCARDVLLASNRTESGGDTYFAIESMLINKRFAVLTPLASEEEPLEIIVDIVESKRNSFHHRSRDELHVQPAPRTDTSKRADDFTDSSGLSYSVSTTDDNMFDRVTLSQFQDQFGDSNDLSMPSDIDGATAIKSTISTSKFVKRRTKDSIKFHSHPSGSASDSSNFSESNHLEESFIPDTSHEETSESADDPFLIRSTSFDSSDSPFLEKSSMNFPTDEKVTGDAECSGRCRDTFSEGFPPTLIPSQYPNPDDVTIDLSEVTLDSALVFREKQISGPSFPSVIRLVSPNPSKSRSEKGLLSHLLNRNEGHDQHHESDKPTYSKKQNALSGIRKALKSRILSTKEIEDPIVDSVSSAAQSMCIRIQMIAKSKYRLCNLDPQNELEDNWAIIHGSFHQVFFLKSHSNGRPSMSDRLVTVKVVSAR